MVEPGRPRAPRRTPVLLHVSVVASYLITSLVLWSAVWISGNPTRTITCMCGDPAEEIWWLEWFPWAIAHGHNPFFTNALYAGSGGVNLLANASIEAPALLLAPITALFGPVAALNTGALLAPVLSGWCMFLLARRFTRFVPGQILAGALWGFSPYVIASLELEHLPHVFGFFAPLSVLVVLDLVVDRKRPAWLDGIFLAALIVVQFFTSTEVLAMTIFIGVMAGVFGLIVFRRQLVAATRRILVGAGTAIAIAVPLLAYPTWFAVAGPRSIAGQPWPQLASQGNAVAAIVNPGWSVHAYFRFPYNALVGYYGPIGPFEGYLGWGLIALIAVSAALWWRRRLAWCLLAIGALAWVLSWGIRSPSWWPWRVFNHVPVVSNIQPERFAYIVTFCAALLLAISLDEWAARVGRWLTRRRSGLLGEGAKRLDGPRVVAGALVTAVGVGVLAPIAATYSVPLTEHAGHRPVWLTTVATRLPPRTRVLALPYGPLLSSKSMAYQATDTLRFDLAGGYQIVPGVGRKTILAAPPPPDQLLASLSYGTPIWGLPEPPANEANLSLLRSTVARWGIQLVAVTNFSNSPYAVSFMTKAFGRSPIRQHGAWVWVMGCDKTGRATGASRSSGASRVSGASRASGANPLCHSHRLKPAHRAHPRLIRAASL